MPHLVWEETEVIRGRPRLKAATPQEKPAPYRLLVEDDGLRVVSKAGHNDNVPVQGDYLEALRGLLPYYAGR